MREPSSPSHSWVRDLVRGPINHSVLQDLQVNPYTAEPTLVTGLMTVFFQHVPEVASCMFPAEAFTAWVQSRSEKSLDDLMLIYSLLALATVFSSQPEHKTVGTQYASIARYACDNRHFTLQLVQSRLALALYYFAINNANDSWDTCGGAIRAASALRLNIEFEKSDDAYLKTLPYGLNRPGFAECRRRTFWSCYLLDRFSGFCTGHFNVIHPADVFLRLPCDAKSFESQVEVHNPYFDPSATSNQGSPETVGAMAYLINICTIWGEVMASVYRTSHRPVPAASNAAFLTFYERTTQRLHAWEESLPAGYQFSVENLMRARDPGQVRTLTLMHSVYHTTAMKLNRYLQLTTLTASQVAQHVSVARQHAESLLSVVDTLAARRGSLPRLGDRDAAADKFSSPFVGYAIVSAIDILTARVSVATLARRLDSFHGAQAILAELALFWQCARTQQALLLQRIRELADLGARGEAGLVSRVGRGIREGILALNEPMERTFSIDYDSIYA
jgi:hypothetical protein